MASEPQALWGLLNELDSNLITGHKYRSPLEQKYLGVLLACKAPKIECECSQVSRYACWIPISYGASLSILVQYYEFYLNLTMGLSTSCRVVFQLLLSFEINWKTFKQHWHLDFSPDRLNQSPLGYGPQHWYFLKVTQVILICNYTLGNFKLEQWFSNSAAH